MHVFKMAVIALACGALTSPTITPSLAKAPMARTQAGYYRIMLGEFEVTALNDGVISYRTNDMLPTAKADQIKDFREQSFLGDTFKLSYNAFLINTGSKLILIDTGTGGKMVDDPLMKGAGRLIANLRAAGYRPEQIDEVYITHRGPDHIGGLTTGSKRSFPNAIVRAAKSEMDMFLDPQASSAFLAKMGNNKPALEFAAFVRELFAPYIKAGRYQTFDGDAALTPGIRALATPGHSPGHTSYIVESGGQTMIIMGDLVLNGMQLADPSLVSRFDGDVRAAAAQRARILGMAADGRFLVAGGHSPFPGIGHVRREGSGYRFIAPNYEIP